MHTYIYAYLHACMHAYINTYIQMDIYRIFECEMVGLLGTNYYSLYLALLSDLPFTEYFLNIFNN